MRVIAIHLDKEPNGLPDSTHGSGHEMVEISVGEGLQKVEMVEISVGEGLQSPETDVVQSFVVQQHALVEFLNDLMEAQDGVVPLHHNVGDLPSSSPEEPPSHPIGSSIKIPGRAPVGHRGN